jgi:hypothetical protein
MEEFFKPRKIDKSKKPAPNRTVYASPPVGGSGYRKTQSAYGLCAFFFRHIFTVAGNLRFPLSQPQKRHIQPERYAQFVLNVFEKIIDKVLKIVYNKTMEEKWIDNILENKEHWQLLSKAYEKINSLKINKILDAGSGKTSLSSLLEYFRNAYIEAITYPNDTRKINSIKENIISKRYKLIEMDICKNKFDCKYDLVLSHLLLGEAVKWGNNFYDLFHKLLNINSEYFIIFDIMEDPSVDYEYIKDYVKNNNYKLIYYDKINKLEPKVYDDFISKTYSIYLIKRI